MKRKPAMKATKALTYALAVISFALLAACGGGGGSSVPVASTASFPLLTVLANALQASSNTYSISGTVNGSAVTGSGTVTRGALSAGTFEGSSAQQRTTTSTGSFIVNGQNIPLNSSGVDWYSSNYYPLGSSSGEDYVVVTGSAVIPTTVKVNDTAIIYTANIYSNSSKTLLRGTATMSYVVEADTETTALLTLISTEKNSVNTVISTSTQQVRITPTGIFTRIKETYVEGSSALTLTY
jgi:hypothetical protein